MDRSIPFFIHRFASDYYVKLVCLITLYLNKMFRIGFDIGSTTAKMVVLDENGNVVFSKYERHNAKVKETVISFLKELLSQVGDEEISIRITGSIGMGVSETCAIPFVQEVVAAAKAIQKDHPAMASMIDIGGEDAKVVFFKDGEPPI